MNNESNDNSKQSADKQSADIVEQQIAQVYAQALLDGAASVDGETTDEQEAILSEFRSLVNDVLDTNRPFETLLGSALIGVDEKIEVLDRVFSGRASKRMLSFLKVLAEHERLDCLRTIYSKAVELHDRRCGKIPVELVLAAETDDGLIEEICKTLCDTLGAEPILKKRIDPSLIAGFYVRAGDKVYDGSVRTHFRHIRDAMVSRSIDRIQTERDQLVEDS